jgi:hypothetical protein
VNRSFATGHIPALLRSFLEETSFVCTWAPKGEHCYISIEWRPWPIIQKSCATYFFQALLCKIEVSRQNIKVDNGRVGKTPSLCSASEQHWNLCQGSTHASTLPQLWLPHCKPPRGI